MKGKKVRFERFVYGEGYTWKKGGEGKIIAETKSFYKVKTGWFFSEWVCKIDCEIINTFKEDKED